MPGTEYLLDDDDRLIRYFNDYETVTVDYWNGKEWKKCDDDINLTICRGPVHEDKVQAILRGEVPG